MNIGTMPYDILLQYYSPFDLLDEPCEMEVQAFEIFYLISN
jgi:hypothetical protein